MIEKIKQDLGELGLSPNEIKVYLALTELGESIASKVAKRAGLKRTTTISLLDKLLSVGYAISRRYHGITYYEVESPKVLQNIFTNKLTIADRLDKLLRDMYRKNAAFPFANVYDTKKGIRGFIENILTNIPRRSFIFTIDAPHQGNYTKVLSESFNEILLSTKKQKDIFTETLIPFGTFTLIEEKKIRGQNIKIREMPEEIDFKASLWFVDKQLVLFSANPPFVVALKHDIIFDSLKSVYDFLWNISLPKN